MKKFERSFNYNFKDTSYKIKIVGELRKGLLPDPMWFLDLYIDDVLIDTNKKSKDEFVITSLLYMEHTIPEKLEKIFNENNSLESQLVKIGYTIIE